MSGATMDFVITRNFDLEDQEAARRRASGADRVFSLEEHNSLIAEAVAKAKEEAYQEGYNAGEEAAKASIIDGCSRTLEVIAPQMKEFLDAAVAHQKTLEVEAMDFAMAVGQKVFPDLIEQISWDRAREEVSRVLSKCVGRPKLKVFVSKEVHETMADDLEDLAASVEHSEDVEILVEEKFSNGDAKVVWDDGFMAYSLEDVCAEIMKTVEAVRTTTNKGKH